MAKVAILGSGNGACTYAAYLGKRGHEVRMYDSELFKDNLTYIQENGGLEMHGADTGFGKIAFVTTNIEEAIKDVDVIMVVVPGFGHKPLAQTLAPHLTKDHLVVLNPGAVFGSLEFLNTLRECGNQEDVTIAETASNIFACRRSGPGDVRIMAKKNEMQISCIPADRISNVIERLEVYFPDLFVAVPNVIFTSFLYSNAMIHPVGSALNMGWIEDTKGNFDFYWQGLSEGVCKNAEAVDAERLALAKAMGFEQMSTVEVMHRYYGHEERDSFYSFFHVSDVHGGTGASAPSNMLHRYISEDTPYGLVPFSELAKVFGVPTPHIDAMITVLSTCNGEDYRKTGRSLEALGLAGLNRNEIIRHLIEGK